jgi:hypothetical protein
MYQVQMQLIPGNDVAWTLKLHPNDPIYSYSTEALANTKASELQSNDVTGRKYRSHLVV